MVDIALQFSNHVFRSVGLGHSCFGDCYAINRWGRRSKLITRFHTTHHRQETITIQYFYLVYLDIINNYMNKKIETFFKKVTEMRYKTDIYNVRRLSDEARRAVENIEYLCLQARREDQEILAATLYNIIHQFTLYLEEEPNE